METFGFVVNADEWHEWRERLKKLEKGHENHGWRISALECPSEMTLQFEKDIAKLKDIVNEIDLYIQSQFGLTERVEKLEEWMKRDNKAIFLITEEQKKRIKYLEDFHIKRPDPEAHYYEQVEKRTCGECKHRRHQDGAGLSMCWRKSEGRYWTHRNRDSFACDKWEGK